MFTSARLCLKSTVQSYHEQISQVFILKNNYLPTSLKEAQQEKEVGMENKQQKQKHRFREYKISLSRFMHDNLK